MSADQDGGRPDAAADNVKITETHSAAGDSAYDVDPDTENYAAGNDPETAYRNQGRPDSPNSWSDYTDAADKSAAMEGKDLESPTIAAREDDRQGADASDARQHGWRRVTSADAWLAGAMINAAGSMTELAIHQTSEGPFSVGTAILTVAGMALARAKRKGKT